MRRLGFNFNGLDLIDDVVKISLRHSEFDTSQFLRKLKQKLCFDENIVPINLLASFI